MNKKKAVLGLAALAMALLLVTSLAGVVLDDGGSSYTFVSVQGEEVEIYGGVGLYRRDSVYKAIAFRSFDWVSLLVVLPLLTWGLRLYRRGQFKGQLLVAAVFTYMAYIYNIGVMGNAFNSSFLLWTAVFGVGLYGLLVTLADMDVAALPGKLASNFPRKGLAAYVVFLGMILLVQYLAQVITAYLTASPPATLEHYTTLELAALELGIMVPLHLISGVLLWKERAWGYVIAILLAFAAFMTFIALSIAALLTYFVYETGSAFDLGVTLVIMTLAAAMSWLALRRVEG